MARTVLRNLSLNDVNDVIVILDHQIEEVRQLVNKVRSGALPFTGDINLGGNRLTNLNSADTDNDALTLGELVDRLDDLEAEAAVLETTGAEDYSGGGRQKRLRQRTSRLKDLIEDTAANLTSALGFPAVVFTVDDGGGNAELTVDTVNFVWDDSNNRLGILTNAPADTFSVGATSQFRISSTGDLVRIRDVPYTWPASNAFGVLLNNGVGTLSWAPASAFAGSPGLDGEDGEPGPLGPTGATGSAGAAGAAGAAGTMGPPGLDGDEGDEGSPGVPGTAGPTGATGATGAAGSMGPSGLDGTDGEEGSPGNIGPQGLQGVTGSTGPQGAQGISGLDGTDGDDGGSGPPGPTGATGATGAGGAAGAAGATGPQGSMGFDGEEGESGPQGPVGAIGPQGPAGGGSGNFGVTTMTFGAFPGASDTSVAVIGQASIVAGSRVLAWIRLEASADHSADEHMLETIEVYAGNIVPGTGFTIYALNACETQEPLEWAPSVRHSVPEVAVALSKAITNPYVGGLASRLYGTWNVQWQWG